jgi:hypothetical protein
MLQFRERKMEWKCLSLATNLPTAEAALTAYPTANRTPQSTIEYAKREKSKNEKSYLLALIDTKIKKARKTPGEDILIFAEFQSKENSGVAVDRIFTGKFCETGIMYDGMIKAFNRAIGPLGKGERANARAR